MAGISESLDTHHARLEAQLARVLDAAQAADWRAYRASFASLHAAVLDHIAFEEGELFPELSRALGSDAEMLALCEQHGRLRRDFDTLCAAAPEHDPEGCMSALEQLGALIREHHEQELRVCYPASDRLLGGDALLGQSARTIAARAPAASQGAPSEGALDLRGLQPPEPIVRIFKALERSPDAPLRAILPHEPVPLYALLRERGFRCSGETRPDGGFEVLIEKGGEGQ